MAGTTKRLNVVLTPWHFSICCINMNMVFRFQNEMLPQIGSLQLHVDFIQHLVREQNWCTTSKSDYKEHVWSSISPQELPHSSQKRASICWKQYQSLSTASKLIYFDIEIPFVNTIMSHMDRDTNHVTYTIDKRLVDVIIWEILWNPEDFEDKIYENAMCVFTLATHTYN